MPPKLDIPVTRTEPDWLRVVGQKVEGLRYGVIQIIVHDSKVVQIERTERIRLAPSPALPEGGEPPR